MKASLFLNLDNILHQANRVDPSLADTAFLSTLLERVETYLTARFPLTIVHRSGYGTLETIYSVAPQLHKQGLSLHPISTDFQEEAVSRTIELEVIEWLHQRPSIDTYILLTGNSQHAALVDRLQQHGKQIIVISFNLGRTLGGYFVKEGLAINALDLLKGIALPSPNGSTEPTFKPITPLPYPLHRDVLHIIESVFGQYDEIYLTPLLRKLSEELGDLEEHTPKSLINDLVNAGAARLEKRTGIPHDYTVLILNPEHPAVQETREEIRIANQHAMHSDLTNEEDELPSFQ